MSKTEESLEQLKAILKTEYSQEFDEKRQRAMINSYYKYGPVGANYTKIGQGEEAYTRVQAIPTLKLCLEKYLETGNKDYLIDIANYAMIEFMYPQHKEAHYRSGTEKDSAGQVGLSVNEMQRFKELHDND